MTIKITTQYIENYDLDNTSPDGYWKFKGGDVHYVTGHDDRPANAVAQVSQGLMNSSHGIEYVSDWEIVPERSITTSGSDYESSDVDYGDFEGV